MTNEITLLKAMTNGATINPEFQPRNNKEAYLAKLCGLDIALPEPRTAEEVLLCKLCVEGIGGGGEKKYLHLMTVETLHFDKTSIVLLNNSEKPLTGKYRHWTDEFNGAILIFRADDIGYDEDIQGTVVDYDYDTDNDAGRIVLDKDLPFPSYTGEDNVVDVRNGQFDDVVVLL